MAKPEHLAISRQFETRIQQGGFAVALSGGGHRATLASLGAMLAIVDRGLGPHVLQVASVSGGSITNAVLALFSDISEMRKPGDLDAVAAPLATRIVNKGVLTKSRIIALLGLPILVAVAAYFAVGALLRSDAVSSFLTLDSTPITWISLSISTVLAMTLLMLVGNAIERLLDRAFFRPPGSANTSRLGRTKGDQVDHVFCATDLVLGLPVYASTMLGGIFYRRLTAESYPHVLGRFREFQTCTATHVTYSGIVRASAAFPGIPPRNVRFPRDDAVVQALDLKIPGTAFLSDGGIWNNLAIQVVREDRFTGHLCVENEETIRPVWMSAEHLPLLAVNGSAPLAPTWSWWYRIPGIAQLKALLQITQILNRNTVLPRVEAIESSIVRRAFLRSGSSREKLALAMDGHDPCTLISDLSPVSEVRALYSDSITPGRYLLDDSYPMFRKGVAAMEEFEELRENPDWKELEEQFGKDRITEGTHLSRISRETAIHILARAYLNTYLATLYLTPLDRESLAGLSGLATRLNRICGD